MKKLVLILVVALLAILPVMADGMFSFQILSDSPLYKEGAADPYAFDTTLSIIMALDENKKPRTIRSVVKEHDPLDTEGVNDKTKYVDMYYMDDALKAENNKYVHMKVGTSVGLLRTTFEGSNFLPKTEFEVNFAGYINTIFNMFTKNETLDFDGSYFLGGTIRFNENVTFRAGLHHFSGHYGDEVLEKYYSYNGVDFNSEYAGGSLITKFSELYEEESSAGKQYYLVEPVEYVRDNSLIAAVSANVLKNVRVYGEAELPMNPSWLRPLAHCPADYDNPVDEEDRPTMITRIGGDSVDGEHVNPTQVEEQENLMRTANGSYKALRIHFGAEAKYDVKFATAFAAFDVQMHQDGQTLHNLGTYNKNNPWEFELTVGGGLEFAAPVFDQHVIRLEAYYHAGRVPATQWFYQRMNYVSVGVAVL